jgi:hypothetical protein
MECGEEDLGFYERETKPKEEEGKRETGMRRTEGGKPAWTGTGDECWYSAGRFPGAAPSPRNDILHSS